jgi:hypothetical protein
MFFVPAPPPTPQKKFTILSRSLSPSISLSPFISLPSPDTTCTMANLTGFSSPTYAPSNGGVPGYDCHGSLGLLSPPPLPKNRPALAGLNSIVSGLTNPAPGDHSRCLAPGVLSANSGSASGLLDSRRTFISEEPHSPSHISISSDDPDTTYTELAGLRNENTKLKVKCSHLQGQVTELKYVSTSLYYRHR